MSTPTLAEQKEYWKYWQRTRTESRYAQERAENVLAVLERMALGRPRILDLGCGTGWFTEQLARFGPATGLDLNDDAMAQAAKRCPHITFIGGDIYEQRLERASFDLVVSLQVIAHVEDQPAFMQRVAELLAPGGHLVISTNNRFVMERLGNSDAGSHAAMGHIEKWLSIGELRALVARHLEVRRVWTVTPTGDAGMLRIANSVKLNRAAEAVLGVERTRRFKERLGLGYTVLVLAQKAHA
jgi:SAM-dependent methyltransferase